MNKCIFVFLLISCNFIFGQDRAEKKMFSKCFTSSPTILKSITDKNGVQTQLVYASGSVTINNKFIPLPKTTLFLMRHHLSDSNNYKYVALSDPATNYSNTNVSDICITRSGIGFCVNINGSALNFNPAYPIYGGSPSSALNCVYLEFDSSFNFTEATRFSSTGQVTITRLVADSNDNKYAYMVFKDNLKVNDTLLFSQSGTFQHILSFKLGKLNWSKNFVAPSSSSITPLQMLESRSEIFILFTSGAKNILYDGHLFCRTSALSYVLFKISDQGNLMTEIESDTVNSLSSSCNMIVSDTKVFLNLPYTGVLKVGNYDFKKSPANSGQVVFEMDRSLTIINAMKLLLTSGFASFKAFSDYDELLYFEVTSSAVQTVGRVIINDTIIYISDWINYPGKNVNSTLFAYSSRNKRLVAAYDISVFTSPTSYFVYCSNSAFPQIYCQYYNRLDILSEGINYASGNNTTIYSFALKKPLVHVAHPYSFVGKRIAAHQTVIEWQNSEVYDSVEIQKFSTFSGSTEYKFKAYGNATSFNDTMFSLLSSYQYKIRGYKNGWPSIFITSDSTSTTDSLQIESFLIVAVVDSNAISLNWGKQKSPIANVFFRSVYRGEQRDGGYVKIADIVPRTLTAFIDTTVRSGIRYYYFVSDYNYMYDVHTDTASATTTGNQIYLGSVFGVYPNPCIDKVFLELSDKKVKAIEVFDMLGKKYELQVIETDGIYYCDLNNLLSGVYTLVSLQNGVAFKTKLVKL